MNKSDLMRRFGSETYEKYAQKRQEALASNDPEKHIAAMKEYRAWVEQSIRQSIPFSGYYFSLSKLL